MTLKPLKELKALDEKALQKEIDENRRHFSAISFEHSQGVLKNTSELRNTRKYIAQMKTIQRQRSIVHSP